MKYCRIICGTPFVGEENNFYIAANSEKELNKIIDECIYENGLEWCDDDMLEVYDYTEEEYFAECHLVDLREITEEEYYETHVPGKRWREK